MTANDANDANTSFEFGETDAYDLCRRIIPWIAKAINLPRNSFDQSYPKFMKVDQSFLNELANSDCAGGAYSPDLNIVAFTQDESGRYCLGYLRSVIVHELVHYLQHMNGQSFDPVSGELMKRELVAYATQGLYLAEIEGINPAKYGLTVDNLQWAAQKSCDNVVDRNKD